MMKKLMKWIREGNDCGECPCYWWEQGYEDCDEGCRLERDALFYGGCRLPRIVRWYKNRQAVFTESHEYDGIEEWFMERERLDNLVAERMKKELGCSVICARHIDTEEKRYWEVDQDECIYRLAHAINAELADDDSRRAKTIRAEWAELLKKTWKRFCFKVRFLLTI